MFNKGEEQACEWGKEKRGGGDPGTGAGILLPPVEGAWGAETCTAAHGEPTLAQVDIPRRTAAHGEPTPEQT